MARDLPKWHTRLTDLIDNPPKTYDPRPHDSEQQARRYMAEVFARRKCNVVLLNPMGQQVDSLNYEPEPPMPSEERFGAPAIVTGRQNPNPDHEELAHEETAAQ